MKWNKAVIAIFVVLALFAVSWLLITSKIDLTMNGAMLGPDGEPTASGEMVIVGTVTEVPFSLSRFKLEKLVLPGLELEGIQPSSAFIVPSQGFPGYSATTGYIRTNSGETLPVDIIISEDSSICFVVVSGQVFVGATGDSPDHTEIMNVWGTTINSFMDK